MTRLLCALALGFLVGCGASAPQATDHGHSADSHHDKEARAEQPLADDAEKGLYLTPKGKYTAADIQANGNTTAPRKFKGIASDHDAMPSVGDKICPISRTKANPQFRWVVDGQPYEFCCPPCIDEFVKLAKDKPEKLKPAASFVQK